MFVYFSDSGNILQDVQFVPIYLDLRSGLFALALSAMLNYGLFLVCSSSEFNPEKSFAELIQWQKT